MSHESKPSGDLIGRKVPVLSRPAVLTVKDALKHGGRPQYSGLTKRFTAWAKSPAVRWREANQGYFERSLRAQYGAEQGARYGAMTAVGHLWLAHVDRGGDLTDLGLASCRVVTNAGVAYIVDAFQNLTELENLKYHALGTGTTAEASTQTALVTELTTQYTTSSTRPTGTLGEQSGNANVFETVATISVSAAVAATEHGLFSTASSGTGVLFDRSLFAAVNLIAGESIQATYDFTVIAGG